MFYLIYNDSSKKIAICTSVDNEDLKLKDPDMNEVLEFVTEEEAKDYAKNKIDQKYIDSSWDYIVPEDLFKTE